jgi:ABC-type glycerol-3-phosphate transport system permease component
LDSPAQPPVASGSVGLTVTVIPVAIFAFIVQKHIISGITGGAISAE